MDQTNPSTGHRHTSTFLAPHPYFTQDCCFRQPGEEIQIGPNWDMSKALNNRYLLLLLRIEGYPRHFGFLLIKIQLLAFELDNKKWKNPKTKKKLFS